MKVDNKTYQDQMNNFFERAIKMQNEETKMNTDKEIWRKIPDDYYSPSIHVTEQNGIGIDVGGYVLVATVECWHRAGQKIFCVDTKLSNWRRKLAYWLLGWKVSGIFKEQTK